MQGILSQLDDLMKALSVYDPEKEQENIAAGASPLLKDDLAEDLDLFFQVTEGRRKSGEPEISVSQREIILGILEVFNSRHGEKFAAFWDIGTTDFDNDWRRIAVLANRYLDKSPDGVR